MEITSIPEAFQTKIRLAIISALIPGEKKFKELKSITSATDGNLGAQLTKLEEMGFVTIEKDFVNKKPQTTYSITKYGLTQFKEYVELLELLLKQGSR